ncbi:MAG: hypothetical protein K0R57_3861 [Paenibacillaceae bacterium]|jgi:phosphoglycerol transferase MdoB-like AlkP superfamily enzyme|nr:hypothetical protein [Paenibacillaceae bacterium]
MKRSRYAQPDGRKELLSALLSRNIVIKTLSIGAALSVATILMGIGIEWIGRGSLSDALNWISANHGLFAVNATLIAGLLLILYSLIGALFLSIAAATALLSLVSLISFYKTKLIGEPFFPWDIILSKEGTNIAPLVTDKAGLLRIGAIVAVILLLVAARLFLGRFAVSWRSRIALGLLAAGTIASFAWQTSWSSQMLARAGASPIIWNQHENYEANGLLLAFTLNIKNSIIAKPAGYGEPAIAGIASQLLEDRKGEQDTVSVFSQTPTPSVSQAPNVIFIMNEAFWDPTLLPNVTFSEDPLPTIHKLQQESRSGYMLSPQFGGGTSNVEFEILTGLSTSLLPSGSIPYQQYISRPLPSLASFFAGNGYRSLAIHPYEGWFWNRNNVYKWLGFEGFKSIGHFTEPEYKGAFISDAEAARSIIQATEESEEPVFTYTVTMQNHGPYDDDRYGGTTISVEGDIPAAAKQMLETYTQGARDADDALRLLIEHYEQSDEPTFIIFYGDHLPMLGYDYYVYEKTGFIHSADIGAWSLEELKKMHSVPYVVWSNFPLENEPEPVISASFLGSYVLNALSLEAPGQFAFNSQLYKTLPGLLRNLAVDSGGSLTQAVPEEWKSFINDYRLLQYDMLFGEQYLAKQMDTEFLTREALPAYNSVETSTGL